MLLPSGRVFHPSIFERTSDPTASNIRISVEFEDHGDDAPFDGPNGALAHAAPHEHGRFHSNGDKKWAIKVAFNSYAWSLLLHMK